MFEYVSIVTIDGPSGVGKSSVSRRIASQLGYTYLDTGAMYRGVGFYIHRKGLKIENEGAILSELENINLTLLPAKAADEDVGVILNDEDVSSRIRTPEMSMIASSISALPGVRTYLTKIQRDLAAKGKVVAEGRDTGTVVFPNARYKFFLDGKAEERCSRRVAQLQQNGVEANEKEILEMIRLRDKNDRERSHAPLKRADDAQLIDTTHLSLEQVCDTILAAIEEKNR